MTERVVVWQADGLWSPGVDAARRIVERLEDAGEDVRLVPLTRRGLRPGELAATRHVLSGGWTDADSGAPWMRRTRRQLGGLIASGHARVVGICLGAQLIAETTVGPGAIRRSQNGVEWGLVEVHGAAAAPPRTVATLHHHEVAETPLVAAGGRLLASNAHTWAQIFELRGARGIQFHAELDPDDLLAATWCHRRFLRSMGCDPRRIAAAVDARRDRWDVSGFRDLVLAHLGGAGTPRTATVHRKALAPAV